MLAGQQETARRSSPGRVGGAPRLLPAHLPPNPSSLQQRAGTTGHSRHPRPPAAGSVAPRKVPSRLRVGQSPGPLGGSRLSAPRGPRGYLHGDGSHAAPGLGRALFLAPSSHSAAAACSRPGPLPGGGAGRLEGGGEGQGNQSRALEPGAGASGLAALRGSVYAESALAAWRSPRAGAGREGSRPGGADQA